MKKKPKIESYLDNYPEIDKTAYIASSSSIIGAVRIGENVSVWHNVTIRGDLNYITIDKGSNIQDNTVIHIDSNVFPTIIGKYVTVGHSSIIHACELKDYSFVGMGAIILDGSVVESDAVVAAGAIVTPGKIVPSGEIWAGNPARFLKKNDLESIKKFRQTAEKYIEFARAAKFGLKGKPYKFNLKSLPKINLKKK